MNQHPLHLKAVSLARNYLLIEKDIIEVFIEIDRKKLFRSWGYSSLFQYSVSGLNLTEAQSYNFISVSRKSSEIPALKLAIQTQEITVSKARKITSVIQTSNASVWIEKAKELKTAELEREVVKANPSVRTTAYVRPLTETLSKVSLCVEHQVVEKLKALQDILSQKKGVSTSMEEVLSWVVEEQLKRVQKPVLGQVECQATIPNGALKRVVKPVLGQVQCQATLPNGVKCGATRFIHMHHKLPKSRGGSNDKENLVPLCANHHRWVHETKPRGLLILT